MDVVGWPRSLGLGKYEAAFGENDIGETVLPISARLRGFLCRSEATGMANISKAS